MPPDDVYLSCWSKLGVEMLVQEKKTTNGGCTIMIHTLTIPPQRFFLTTSSSSSRKSKQVILLLITAAASLILYGILPIVLWIVSLIVQTLQRQEQQRQTQGVSALPSPNEASTTTSVWILAQKVYETACYWTYHIVPRMTASLLTLYIAFCLAYVGWLKVQQQQQQQSARVRRR